MKKYIFFHPNVGNMGGGQMYVHNKIRWLKTQEWQVEYICCSNDNIILPEFSKMGMVEKAIGFSLYMFNNVYRKKTLRKIVSYLADEHVEEYVIESTSLPCATWGEVVAELLGCKHLVYIIDETTNIDNNQVYDFLHFKHNRKEIASITNTSLYKLFLNDKINISEDTSYSLPAYCNNVVGDYDSPLYHELLSTRCDYYIGSIGRLDKPYLLPMLHQLKEYMLKNRSISFSIVLIGGSSAGDNIFKEIEDLYKDVNNVKLIITGFMFPIPQNVIRLCDVFISSAGSAFVSNREGVPTISIDAEDYLPIGVVGQTTTNSVYRSDDEPPLNLSDLLDDILIKKTYSSIAPTEGQKIVFDEHIAFINNSDSSKDYYDFQKIKLPILDHLPLRLSLLILGPQLYQTLSKRVNNLC